MRPDVVLAILPPLLLCWYVGVFWICKKVEPEVPGDSMFAIASGSLMVIAIALTLLFIWLHCVASSLGFCEPFRDMRRADVRAELDQPRPER